MGTTRTMQQLKALLLALIVATGFAACTDKNEVETPENPGAQTTPVSPEDYVTVPTSGGTITKGDITITFPESTFPKDEKVAVTEIKKGSIGGDLEASRFHKITIPSTTDQPITIRIEGEEADDVRFVMQTLGCTSSYDEEVEIDYYTEAEYSDGAYTLTLPAINNGKEVSGETYFNIGVAHFPDLTGSRATRGITLAGGQIGDIKWEIDYTITLYPTLMFNSSKLNQAERMKKVLNQYVRDAITKITDLGFKIEGKRTIPIYIQSLPDKWGQHNQSTLSDSKSSVSISWEKLMEADPDIQGLKMTIIHELFHYFQAEYDPRCAYIKGRTTFSPTGVLGIDPEELVTDAVVMYEMGAVWIEQFMNDGQLSADFLAQEVFNESILGDYTGFPDILNTWYGGSKKIKYQNQGYSMAPLLYYITKKLDDGNLYGIDNSFVLKLHELWKTRFKNQSFWSTTYDCLKDLTFMTYKNYFFYGNIDDFILQLVIGDLIKGFYIHTHNVEDGFDKNRFLTQNQKNQKTTNGKYDFEGVCWPFGFSIRQVTLSGLRDSVLTNKELVIKQETEDMNTYLLISDKSSNFTKFKKATKVATTKDSIVIQGDVLEKLRLDDGSFFHDFFLITTRAHSDNNKKTYNLSFNMRNAVSVSPDSLGFDNEGGTQSTYIKFGTYHYYGATVRSEGYGWCGVAAPGGPSGEIKVTVQPNLTGKERECIVDCYVSLTANPSDEEKIIMPVKVTQGAGQDASDVDIEYFRYESNYKVQETWSYEGSEHPQDPRSVGCVFNTSVTYDEDVHISSKLNGSTLHLEGSKSYPHESGGSYQAKFSCDITGFAGDYKNARVTNVVYKSTDDYGDNERRSYEEHLTNLPFKSYYPSNPYMSYCHLSLEGSVANGMQITYTSIEESWTFADGTPVTSTAKYINESTNNARLEIHFNPKSSGNAPRRSVLHSMPWNSVAPTKRLQTQVTVSAK